MFKTIRGCKLALLALLALPAAQSLAQQAIIPRPPQVAASSYILTDAKTGAVLVEHNADLPLSPASLTKIMTSYVAAYELGAGSVSLDDQVFVSVRAWRAEGSRMFIQEGGRVRLEDLLRGMVVQSGNDASIALAEHIAGSEEAFADMMNTHGERLGLQNSHFINASGLTDDLHSMSARDLAILSQALIRDFPEHYRMYAEREFTYNDIRQPNRNTLLFRDPSVDGIKTGYTEDAGYCLAVSAKRNDMRLIAVVMGTDSNEARVTESQKLLAYGFRFFQTHRLFDGKVTLDSSQVWYGKASSVNVGVADEVFITMPRGQEDNLETELTMASALKAPIEEGQPLGTVRIKLGEQVLHEGPLVAMEAVARGNLLKRLMDFLHLFFLNLFS